MKSIKKRTAIAGVVGITALWGLLAWCVWPAPPAPVELGPAAGAALGRATGRALAEAPAWRLPSPCMELPEPASAAALELTVGARTYVFEGVRLIGGDSGKRHVLVGVVADARGATPETLAAARAATVAFAAAHADVVISLGGQGQRREDIEAVLGALAAEGAWLLVALPGDREDVEAHRAAIAALAARGLPVVDGSKLGMLVVDGVAVALLPGAPAAADGRTHGLVAGADGCAREAGDLAAVATRLAAEPGPRMIASHRPPRQRGLAATDLAIGGVHVGERALAELAELAGAVVFVHAQVDETAGRSASPVWSAVSSVLPTFTWADRLVVSVGPLEALPHPTLAGDMSGPSAVLVEIDHMRARVRSLRPSAQVPENLR